MGSKGRKMSGRSTKVQSGWHWMFVRPKASFRPFYIRSRCLSPAPSTYTKKCVFLAHGSRRSALKNTKFQTFPLAFRMTLKTPTLTVIKCSSTKKRWHLFGLEDAVLMRSYPDARHRIPLFPFDKKRCSLTGSLQS